MFNIFVHSDEPKASQLRTEYFDCPDLEVLLAKMFLLHGMGMGSLSWNCSGQLCLTFNIPFVYANGTGVFLVNALKFYI